MPGSGSQASTPSARNHWRATSPCSCSVSKFATIAASPYGRSSKAMPRRAARRNRDRRRPRAGRPRCARRPRARPTPCAPSHAEIDRLRAVRDGDVGQRGGVGSRGRARGARPRASTRAHAPGRAENARRTPPSPKISMRRTAATRATSSPSHAPRSRRNARVPGLTASTRSVVRLAAGRGPPRRRLEHAHLAAGASRRRTPCRPARRPRRGRAPVTARPRRSCDRRSRAAPPGTRSSAASASPRPQVGNAARVGERADQEIGEQRRRAWHRAAAPRDSAASISRSPTASRGVARSRPASAAASRSPRFRPWPAIGCSACAALPTITVRSATGVFMVRSLSGNADALLDRHEAPGAIAERLLQRREERRRRRARGGAPRPRRGARSRPARSGRRRAAAPAAPAA